MKEKISYIILGVILGLFLGAVLGSLLDNLLNIQVLSKSMHSPIGFNFYIIKIEIQLTPASLVGMVVTSYLVIRKG